MKLYKAYVEIENGIPTQFIISGKNKKSVKNKLTDFFYKLDENVKVKIELKEVYFDENNYIEMEERTI